MRKIFVFVMAVLLIGGISRATDSTKFGVTSYVPERFVDLQWSMSGNASFRGEASSMDRGRWSGSALGSEWSRNRDDDLQDIRLGSAFRYQKTTIPLAIGAGVNASLMAGHTNSDQTYDRGSYFGWEKIHMVNSRRSWGFSVGPNLWLTKYVWRDLFIGGTISEAFVYNGSYSFGLNERIGYDSSDLFISGWRDSSKIDYYSLQSSTFASVQLGLGRVYSGDFAYTAMSIVRELRKGGKLEHEPSHNQMKGLCDTILLYRQRHAVDSRLHKIATLHAILTYMQSIGAVATIDGLTPFLIADVWDYFPRESRSFGFRMTGGVDLNYWSEYTDEKRREYDDPNPVVVRRFENRRYRGTVGLTGRLEIARPLSYHWQLGAIGQLRYVANQYWDDSYLSPTRTDRGYVVHLLSTSLAYYFDSRTSLNATAVADGNTERQSSIYTFRRDHHYSLLATLIYRISVPTILKIRGGEEWWRYSLDNPFQTDRNHSFTFSASFEYWLY